MEPSAEELERIYSQYNTEELIHIATKAAHTLRPEAQVVIRAMLKARNVSPEVLDGMDLMLRPPNSAKFDEQLALLRSLPCPICANNSAPLNAVLASRAISFIIMTNYDRTPVIGCIECLRKRCNKASVISLFAGWWGFPWGPIRTIQAFVQNHGQKRKVLSGAASETLVAFVLESTGKIEAYKNDRTKLLAVITEPL